MPPAAPETSPETMSGPFAMLFTALRILGFVALALMLLSILYAGWIALENWSTIQV